MSTIKWACGLTTVPSRIKTPLTRTLNSLCDVGFEDVRLFVDGCDDPSLYKDFGRPVTCRPNPPIKIVGNFMLALAELYLREPFADRYIIFQDDLVCVRNLRSYLEACPYPKDSYLNLYLFEVNYRKIGGPKASKGWHLSNQRGLGALALCFDQNATKALLSCRDLVDKPQAAKKNRSWKAIDGGIVTGLNKVGIKEYVHNPSLVQHIGDHKSTLENNSHVYQTPTKHFPGERFDAMELLK